MVREGDWKLIGKASKPTRLYNLKDKLPERKNYLSAEPKLVSQLFNKYLLWFKEVTPVQ